MAKKDKLLQYLQNNPGWHTSQELALEIGSSKRTIKNYISQLKESDYSILSGARGYKFDSLKNASPSFQVHKNKDIPNTKTERVNYIINFLINDASTLNSYDLSQELFVSETTILQDLKTVQSKVERFSMKLKRDGDYWHLIGNERAKRSLLSSLIYEETSGTFMNRSIIQDNFPEIDVSKLRTTILNTCNENNIYLNTFDLNNVLLHFAIVINRLNNGHVMHQNDLVRQNGKHEINDLAYQVVKEIEKKFNVSLEEADRKELALIVQASIAGNSVSDSINPQTKELVADLISYVWKAYQINLNNDNFKERFSLHLDRLIARARSNKPKHNPIAGNIKTSSPTIYECAVIMAHRISEKIKAPIDDSEIAYIALHVGNAIAEQMADRQKLGILVLIPQYYDNSVILSNKLQEQFSNYISIKGIITDPSQIKNFGPNVDLIVSVNSNYVDDKISTVNISQFLLPDDIQKLNVAITTKQHLVKKDKFQEHLLTFFDSTNFIKSTKLKNIDQVFDLVSDSFQKQGIVNSDFEKRLYQREKMSSTAFGRIAIPHSLDMASNKSRGYIIINPRGIKWSDDNEVYLVIVLAIDPNNKQLFRDVFDELSDIVTDINNVSELIKCQNYSEFIIKLVDLL